MKYEFERKFEGNITSCITIQRFNKTPDIILIIFPASFFLIIKNDEIKFGIPLMSNSAIPGNI